MANGARRRRSSGGARRGGGGGGRRGGGGGGGRRGGYGGGRGGGGNNAMPMIIAGVLVLVVIVVIVLASKPKKQKEPYKSTELTADSPNPDGGAGDTGPKKLPPPPLPDDIRTMAAGIVANMERIKPEADKLYDEGIQAKQDGDRDKWKSKLNEAVGMYDEIRAEWNGLIEEVMGLGIDNADWDAEQIVNHHLAREGEKISKALKRLAYIKKQLPAN